MSENKGRPPTRRHRVKHGTEAGYAWHRRQPESPCPLCRRAHAAYVTEQRAKLRRQKATLQAILSGGQGVAQGQRLTDADTREILQQIREALDL